MSAPRISLEQWRALVAVVDAGGYAQAGERLHKTQSSVSYAVQKIEQMLDLRLFEMQGRRAVLTGPGRMLYRRAHALIDEAERIERAAGSLAAGCETELRLAVEIVFPTWLLLQCLDRFGQDYPEMRIELFESVLGGTDELLLEGRVDLAIGSQVPPGFYGDLLIEMQAIAAAAPQHPLHHLGRPLEPEDLREHRHILIRDSSRDRTRNAGWQGSERRWTVSHKATSIRAATMGLGYAWYAEEIIRDELASGTLRPLPLREGSRRPIPLFLIHTDRDAVGPGMRHLVTILRAALASFPGAVPAGPPGDLAVVPVHGGPALSA